MGEWLKPAVLKTVSGVTRSGVRIPLPPPDIKNPPTSIWQALGSFSPSGDASWPTQRVDCVASSGAKAARNQNTLTGLEPTVAKAGEA
jgi:hypothetical protein